VAGALLPALLLVGGAARGEPPDAGGNWVPTGQFVTPTAAPGARVDDLLVPEPNGRSRPVGQAVTARASPDGATLLVLTSGFNRTFAPDGRVDPTRSGESIFCYEVGATGAVLTQVLTIPNAFVGLAFAPDGTRFYASGGRDDDVHVFRRERGRWTEEATIALHNGPGLSLNADPAQKPAPIGALTAGLAVTADGRRLVAANYEHDSISIVDTGRGAVVETLDLRPGKADTAAHGVAGGEFPYDVAIRGNDTAFVTSVRDRELVVVALGEHARVVRRVPLAGNPNRLLLDRAGRHLFVALDNTDRVAVVDTERLEVVAGGVTRLAPAAQRGDTRPGASPNALALAPDERTLYVTNGGENSVAVLRVDLAERELEYRGAIPTGWYPNAVVTARDGRTLYVVNGKSPAGPDSSNCARVTAADHEAAGCPASAPHRAGNEYVLQLTRSSLLTIPVPDAHALAPLTLQVARNNGLSFALSARDRRLFAALRRRIRHVIYVIKENRTYDQVLGDLPGAAGDPALAQFPRATTPNLHALASEFVTLDHFYCTSEVSMDGWQWSTGARTVDINEKTMPIYYGQRGASYDSEGPSRDVNVAAGDSARRAALNPLQRVAPADDPDLLPGTANEMELDGPAGEPGAGYLWNAALRAGKTVRNYGFLVDLARYESRATVGGASVAVPLVRDPRATATPVAFAANAALAPFTDPYFRGFDTRFPDFYREREWATEFAGYVRDRNLPALSLVRLMNDHTGDYAEAIDGVNTPELQQADNDYAVGRLVEAVAASPYAADTLVFVVEDDAQDGPDHLDAHRSPAFVVGPYVRQGGAVVAARYTTVSMIRTIEEVLGLAPFNVHDRAAAPMGDVFDLARGRWAFHARPSALLRRTALPLPPPTDAERADGALQPTHDAAWWAAATVGFDFSREDRVDPDAFNRVLWRGLMGARPYPTARETGGAD
jgi:DNA-binding beta-propeller fold protein YncE